MKKLGIFRGGYSRAFPLAVGLLSSFVAFAGTANVNVYWTRGFDGTGTFEETTSNNIFTEEGGTIFTDRLMMGANTIADVDAMGVTNTETGARSDESITADYASDGSVYLHVGYVNSGFVGSGTTLNNTINLNGDLVLGRMGVENVYDRGEGNVLTPNIPTTISAGDSDYTITFDYSGTASELFFYRGNNGTTSDIFSTTFTLDSNVDVVSGVLGSDPKSAYYLFNVSANNHLILGSKDHQRTFTVRDSGNFEEGIFMVYGSGSLTSYSDMVINGGGKFVFRGQGSFYLYGDILWEVKDSPGYSPFMTLSGDTSTAYPAGVALLEGNLTIDASTTSSAIDVFYLNRFGNVLTVNGDIIVKDANPYSGFSMFLTKTSNQAINVNGAIKIDKVSMANGTSRLFYLNGETGDVSVTNSITINDTGTRPFFIYDDSPDVKNGLSGNNKIVSTGDIVINSITSSDFEVIRMNGDNGVATFDGDLYINNKTVNTSTAYGYRLYAKNNLHLTVNGDVYLDGKYKGSIFSVGSGVSNSVVDMYGDIIITDNQGKTDFSQGTYLFYNNSPTSQINFYGDIIITANVSNETILGGTRASGTVTNFYGRIDTTARTVQTSFLSSSGVALDSIVNFRGSVDNTFDNIGFRKSVFNLLNTNDSAAANVQSYVALGGMARVNVFGENQLKVSPNARWDLWGATEGNSGIVNLNGTSLEIGTINFTGSSRNLILDFGMSDHGMTSEQLAAQGITSEMINATGSGESQTISILGITFNAASLVEDCYVLIRNFIVGEDRVLSYTKLSELELNGTIAYSDSVLEGNVLRFDGYTDSEKYGSEYYLAEVETTDAYGAPCWEYYIIPEPSEVAALIGTLALGFAFLRRKK